MMEMLMGARDDVDVCPVTQACRQGCARPTTWVARLNNSEISFK